MSRRPLIDFKRCLDCSRQRPAMHFRILEFATGIGILIAAATHHEQCRHARMIFLKVFLRVTGVVSQPFEKTHRGVMAGITEHDRTQLAVGIADAQYRHRMIDAAVRIGVIAETSDGRRAAIHGKAATGGAV